MNWFKRWRDRRLEMLAVKVAARIETMKPARIEPTKIDFSMYENYELDDTFTVGEIHKYKMKNPRKKPKQKRKG